MDRIGTDGLTGFTWLSDNRSDADLKKDRQNVAWFNRTDQPDFPDLGGDDVGAIDAVMEGFRDEDLSLIDLLAADLLFDPNSDSEKIDPVTNS